MTRPIADLDVPLPILRQQLRDLVARQRKQQAAVAPTPTTPKEGQP
jgi:hypothetical protein